MRSNNLAFGNRYDQSTISVVLWRQIDRTDTDSEA